MFWLKCDKFLMDDSGKFIDCETCPCGFWAVFGIKYRWLNCETMQPNNECSWYFDITVQEVKQGSIQLFNFYQPVCVNVKQQMGFCGSKKIKIYQEWESCLKWNDDWTECLEYGFPCMEAVEVEIFNLSGCFDDYIQFAEYFYSFCGVQPDSNQKYPDITYYQYDWLYFTNQGQSCINSYWKPLFLEKYALNYKISVGIKGQCWWTSLGATKWSYITEYYTYCLDNDTNSWVECETYSNGTCETCPEGARLITEEHKYEDKQIDFGSECYFYSPPNDQRTIEKFISTGGHYDQDGNFTINCQDQLNVDSALPELNSFIREHVADRSLYGVYSNSAFYYNRKGTGWSENTCQNSNSLCMKAEWQSGKHDNYYGSQTLGSWVFRCCQFFISRTEKTPEKAIGIKFKIVDKNNKWNWKQNNNNINNITESVYQISLNFGETYYFPLHTHYNLYSVKEKPTCNNDGYLQGEWIIDGQINGGNSDKIETLMETSTVNIIGIQYIWSEE